MKTSEIIENSGHSSSILKGLELFQAVQNGAERGEVHNKEFQF
jgi:hypothetical protein